MACNYSPFSRHILGTERAANVVNWISQATPVLQVEYLECRQLAITRYHDTNLEAANGKAKTNLPEERGLEEIPS